MRKLLDSEEKVKYSGFWAVIGMFWAFSAQAQMPYLDEVKALGAVEMRIARASSSKVPYLEAPQAIPCPATAPSAFTSSR